MSIMKTRPRATALLLVFLLATALALAAGCGEKSWDQGAQGGKGEEAAAPSAQQNQAGGSQQTGQTGQISTTGQQLLTNGDFTGGLSGWVVIDQGGSRAHGTNQTEVVVDGGGPAVWFTRLCPQNDGGASGVSQALQATLNPGEKLVLSARIKAVGQRGGAIAGSDPRWYPEGPVQFRISYTRADGSAGEWYHGFYYGDVPGADTARFTQVPQGQWQEYGNAGLAAEILGNSGQAVTITGFRVYGFGWDFDGYAAALSLAKN
jgi:hypothetical protein